MCVEGIALIYGVAITRNVLDECLVHATGISIVIFSLW